MRTGGLCFPFGACHRAVVKRKQGPCPSRVRAPKGSTLPIPSPDSSRLTMGRRFFVPLFSGQGEVDGAWKDPDSLSSNLTTGLTPGTFMKDATPGHDRWSGAKAEAGRGVL